MAAGLEVEVATVSDTTTRAVSDTFLGGAATTGRATACFGAEGLNLVPRLAAEHDNIRAASFLAMEVIRGGDFIKTSTGKTTSNATLGNNQVMIEAIRDFYLDTDIAIGMKPAATRVSP